MTRQNYYAKRKKRNRQDIDKELILKLVKEERHVQPQLGARKIHKLIEKELKENKVSLGRDRLFGLLRENKLLIEKKKAFMPKTTNSRHSLPVFSNLISNLEATGPNQIWVSDLTYIRTIEGFIYASLITDAYSRKIVGMNVGDTLEAEGCIKSLKNALRELPKDRYPIHHSDRGSQYCCHAYVKILTEADLSISMTERNHCYENAMAERMNGILKQEYGLGEEFQSKEQAKKACYQAMELYNNRRPHMSLNYRIPTEVHQKKVA